MLQVHYKYDVWCFYEIADPTQPGDATNKVSYFEI